MERKSAVITTLEKDLADMENAIDQVAEYKKRLSNNADEVKQAIQLAVSKQMVGLHSRQTQLLRQVDALVCHQMSLLQSHYAVLHQTCGSLKTAIKVASTHGSGSLVRDTVPHVSVPNIKSPPSLTLVLDDQRPGAAAETFGRIQIDGFLDMAENESSASLPNRVEYYNDDDHMVLYKPLPSADVESTLHVKVAFPKLPEEKNYWLLNSSASKKRPSSQKVTGSEVEKWLLHMKDDVVPEPDLSSSELESYEVLAKLDKVSSSYADSIEIISDSELSQEIAKDTGREKVYNCTCKEPPEDMEIENLDLIACVNDKDRWLIGRDAGRSGRAAVTIGDVCRANEPCETFDDCLCDDNCREVGDNNSCVSVMSALTQSYDRNTKWILKHGAEEKLDADQSESKQMAYIPPSGQWLLNQSAEQLGGPAQPPSVFGVCLATVGAPELWLLRPQVAQSPSEVWMEEKMKWLAVGTQASPFADIKHELDKIAGDCDVNKWLLR